MKHAPMLSRITRRRLVNATLVIFGMIGFGALGFHYFENLSLVDSIYHATETVTTVGYGDFAPKTIEGRIFSTFFMLLGAGTVLFALTVVAQAVVQSELVESLGQRQNYAKWKNSKIILSSAARAASGGGSSATCKRKNCPS